MLFNIVRKVTKVEMAQMSAMFAVETAERNRLKSLDRHELEKIIESLGIEVYPYETTDSLRETLGDYLRQNEIKLEDVL